MTTLRELLVRVERILLESPTLRDRGATGIEAQRIVEEACRRTIGRAPNAMELRLDAERIQAGNAAVEQSEDWARRRRDGGLLQHLLGRWSFLDHEYEVSPEVLVPRPETECLVMETLAVLDAAGTLPKRGAEIGLGSGILSVELLDRFPALEMAATEVSEGALAIARRNAVTILGISGARRLHALRVSGSASPVREMAEAAGAEGLGPGTFDFLISNPPYLDPARAEEEVEAEVLRHEPFGALFGPADDVLHFYRDMAGGAAYLLNPAGFVAVELPHERADEIAALFAAEGWKARLVPDLTGRNRVLIASRQAVTLER